MPAFVYWVAGTLAANGSPDAPTAGVIVAFTTLQSRLFFPLGQLLGIQVEIQGSLALFDRIFEYLEMDPEIVDAPDAVAMHPATTRGKVRFHDVSFAYPTEAVPSQRAHDAMARGHDHDGDGVERLAEPEWAPEAELAFDEAVAEAAAVFEAAGASAADTGSDSGGRGEWRGRWRGGRGRRGGGGSRRRQGPCLRARARRVRGRAGRARRPGRAVGLGQDDDHLPRLAAVRRRRRRGRDRRRRRPPDQARIARGDHRHGDPGDVPLPRLGQRQPALRAARGDRGRGRGRGDGRLDP